MDMDPVILGAVETPWLKGMVEGWGCTKSQVPALRSMAALFAQIAKETILCGRLIGVGIVAALGQIINTRGHSAPNQASDELE